MQAFAKTPLSIKEILKKSFQDWWPSLKLIWPLMLGLVALREIFCPACTFLNSQVNALQVFVLIVIVLIDISLWVGISVILYHAYQSPTEVDRGRDLQVMAMRSPWLLLALLIYLALISLGALLGYGLGLLLVKHIAANSALFKVLPLLIGLPMIYVLVLFLFTLPLMIIDKLSLWAAFKQSALITGPGWLRAFFAYVGLVFLIAILRSVWIWGSTLNLPVPVNLLLDVLAFILLVPAVANYYVLSLHDLKLRAK